MGSFNQNILPASTGLSLGNSAQAWNVFAQTLSVTNNSINLGAIAGSINIGPTNLITLVSMILSGNITSHTFNGGGLPAGSIVIYKIVQNVIGGYTFTWPATAIGATPIGSAANQATYQIFFWDGGNLIALGPGMLNP